MATNAKAKRAKMLFENKNAVIYGGGGAIGGAVARVFAREGAKIYTAGRTQARLDAVARDVVARGGEIETAGPQRVIVGRAAGMSPSARSAAIGTCEGRRLISLRTAF